MAIDLGTFSVTASFVAALVSMIAGFVWYDVLFRKKWMKLAGKTEKDMKAGKKEMPKMFAKGFVVVLLMSVILGVFISSFGITTIIGALGIGVLTWLGFGATIQYNSVLYENQKPELFILNTGYQLVSYVLMAVVHVLI